MRSAYSARGCVANPIARGAKPGITTTARLAGGNLQSSMAQTSSAKVGDWRGLSTRGRLWMGVQELFRRSEDWDELVESQRL